MTNNGLASTGSDTTAIATLAAIMTIAGAGCVLVRVLTPSVPMDGMQSRTDSHRTKRVLPAFDPKQGEAGKTVFPHTEAKR
ncbi:MAG: hypothetical protein ACLT3W_06335 [Bifidobacterium pseudocatenulatum]